MQVHETPLVALHLSGIQKLSGESHPEIDVDAAPCPLPSRRGRFTGFRSGGATTGGYVAPSTGGCHGVSYSRAGYGIREGCFSRSCKKEHGRVLELYTSWASTSISVKINHVRVKLRSQMSKCANIFRNLIDNLLCFLRLMRLMETKPLDAHVINSFEYYKLVLQLSPLDLGHKTVISTTDCACEQTNRTFPTLNQCLNLATFRLIQKTTLRNLDGSYKSSIFQEHWKMMYCYRCTLTTASVTKSLLRLAASSTSSPAEAHRLEQKRIRNMLVGEVLEKVWAPCVDDWHSPEEWSVLKNNGSRHIRLP